VAKGDVAYQRLPVDERRRQLIDAGSRLFAERSYEDISMQEIARAAGVSKPLLYHYFPSKIDLFKAAVAEKAAELQALLVPTAEGEPVSQLSGILDAYLGWIEANAETWSKLMRSAAVLPDAGELVEGFRQQTMAMILAQLSPGGEPRPALRTAVRGWLGYLDAAILDWTQRRDLRADQLRDLLIAAFTASLFAAEQADPEIELALKRSSAELFAP
jgi:AcrR family transcriptional regulator